MKFEYLISNHECQYDLIEQRMGHRVQSSLIQTSFCLLHFAGVRDDHLAKWPRSNTFC